MDTKERRLLSRCFPEGSTPVTRDGVKGTAFAYDGQRADGKPYFGAVAYRGTAGRPTFHYT